ncbi:MAG: T9SS type A sorting domain-containing protein [Saprospiraceae bacterium]|nr:T9SS type A sorting domain-containing protein [Saprospiraceae bacterium]
MKTIYTLALVGLFALAALAQTNLPPGTPLVTDLEVTVSSKSYYKIQQGITWEDLNPIDLVGLKNREQVERIHEFLDEDLNLIMTYEAISHVNAHPKWYNVPALTIHGPNGVHLQMDPDNPGPNDRFVSYEPTDSVAYLDDNQEAIENGFLAGYTFTFPSQDQVTDAENMYDDVIWSNDGQTLTFSYDSRSDIWDQEKKTKVSVSPQQSGNGFIRITHYYTFNETQQCDLLRAVVIEQDMMLDGGICGKEVTIEEYSDYSFKGAGANPRSSANSTALTDFTVFPNPMRTDMLNITIPPALIGQEVLARVVNITGQPLYEVRLSFPSEKQRIRLNTDQYTEGLYFLQLVVAGSTYAKSFYITK